MSEEAIATSGTKCPMCGATIERVDRTCPACGENLTTIAAPLEASGDGLTVEEIIAFVGRRADYYLRKWKWALADGGNGGTGFNWAAFFLSGLWLPYRKMYRATAIFFGIIFAESIAEEILFVGILGEAEVPTVIDRVSNLVVAAICGAYGNAWYLSHTRKKIATLRSQGLPTEEYLHSLSRRGGTSLAASIGLFILFVVAMIAMFAALEMVTAGN